VPFNSDCLDDIEKTAELTNRRKMSAAARAKISAAAKARWAKVRGEKASVKPAKEAKRKISATGIARIRAAQKARWAKFKAAKK
jgi:hypothetical protein